jgi:hypothetical protein
MVVSLSMDLVRNSLLMEAAENETGIAINMLEQYGYPKLDFDSWRDARDKSDSIERAVAQVEKKTEGIALTLMNVRVESATESLRRVICIAQLESSTGVSLDIRYSVQYMEDEQIWVEVKLL